MNRAFLICSLLIILAGFACRDHPAGPDTGDLHLRAEDVSVTDLYLRVKVTQSNKYASAQVELDDSLTRGV